MTLTEGIPVGHLLEHALGGAEGPEEEHCTTAKHEEDKHGSQASEDDAVEIVAAEEARPAEKRNQPSPHQPSTLLPTHTGSQSRKRHD
jgi:hypothetical protein